MMTVDMSSSTSSVWANWTTTPASTTTYDCVWETWNQGTSASSGTYQYRYVFPESSPSQNSDVPRKKAEALLCSLLTSEQREQLEKQSAFIVKSELGKMYRIRRGSAQNIDELDAKGKPTHRLCIQCADELPVADLMAIQKLMLEMDEARLLKIAIRTPIR